MSDAYKRFSKILKQSGASVNGVSFQWMFDDETVPAHKLLHWIADNITEDNYLSATEQREYEELLARGDYLTGEELSESMSTLEQEYPRICQDSTDDTEVLEQIEMLTRQTELIRQCIDECDVTSTQSTYEKLKNHNYVLSSELKSAEEDCSKAISSFQDAENDLQYSMLQIQKLYDQEKSGNIFLNQMDMEALIETLQLTRKYTKLYLERQFANNVTIGHENDLLMLYERLVEGYQYDMCYEADLEAWKTCHGELPAIYNKVRTIAECDTEIDCLKMKAITLGHEVENSMQEIKSAAEKYALRLLMKAQYEDNEHKLAKRRLSHEKLMQIESFLQDRICIWEILWRMTSIEGTFIEHMLSVYKEVQSKQKVRERSVILRVHGLNKLLKIQSEKPDLQRNSALCDWCIQFLQLKGIKLKAFGENFNIIDVYNKLVSETNTNIDLCRSKLNSVSGNMKKLDDIIGKKNVLIFNGISKSPICISPMHYAIYNCRNNLLELDTEIQAVKNIFKIKKKSIECSVVLDAQRQLWTSFLCEPKKVLSTLENIKTMIQSSSKMNRKMH